MKKRRSREIRFAVCITDREPDLQMGKIYHILPDRSEGKSNYLRIADESRGDYLYPAEYFVVIKLPEEAERALLVAS